MSDSTFTGRQIDLPVSAGALLDTPNTRKFSDEMRRAASYQERCSIYANFRLDDQGKSRTLIATCPTPELAQEVVDLINNTTIKVVDHGMVAEHNMPCCVYTDTEPAVLNMNAGVFEPSWKAQREDWALIKISGWKRKVLVWLGVLPRP